MQKLIILSALCGVLVLGLSGCGKSDDQEPSDANTAAARAKREAGEALQAAGDLLAQKKQQLLERSQGRLSALEQKYRDMKEETAAAGEQAQQKLQQLQENFESELAAAREALDDARNAGSDAWDSTKSKVSDAVQATQKAYDAFLSEMKSSGQQADPEQE